MPPASSSASAAAGAAGLGAATRIGGPSLLIVLLLFLLAAAAVNPLRETPQDDDWAYAETVKHFVETGEYRLNGWLSANIPFQTVWGALFCLPAGFSFGALRCSTIMLAVIGLVAFRALAREHQIGRGTANLLTLCIASSPIFFRMSMTFMSDVPFFATMTVALLVYTRALRRQTWWEWTAASLAGAAAILTRQFGVALLGALALIWLGDGRRFERLTRYVLGAALPVVATAWQLHRGWNHPNWAAAHNLARQHAWLSSRGFLESLPWRPVIIVEYLAWFLIPVALVAGISVFRQDFDSKPVPFANPKSKIQNLKSLELLAWTCLFGAAIPYGHLLLRAPEFMPFLPWNFEILNLPGAKFLILRIVATVIAIAGGALFALFIVRRYRFVSQGPRDLAEWFLDATAFFSLALTLVFFLFGDEYLLVFLPYAAIAIGRQLEPVLWARSRALSVICVAILLGAAIWTREGLCRDEAIWTLAERLHASGIPTQKIFAGWQWAGYYHFDDFARAHSPTKTSTYSEFLVTWTAERERGADYLIVHDSRPPAGKPWEIIDRYEYFSVFSRDAETFYAVRR